MEVELWLEGKYQFTLDTPAVPCIKEEIYYGDYKYEVIGIAHVIDIARIERHPRYETTRIYLKDVT